MVELAKPNFLIPGASRSGTSSLYHYLQEHDEIFMPNQKELRFFDREENYHRGLKYYEKQFANWEGEQAVGEASPPYWNRGITFDHSGNYRFDPADDGPTRIAESYPEIKLILTLRNPIRRAYSQYWKNIRQGREDVRPFRDAIEAELAGRRDHESSELCWVYRNDYPVHLKHCFDLFPRDHVRIFIFEEWIEDINSALNDICEFLSIAPKDDWTRINGKKNAATIPRSYWINNLYHTYLADTPVGAPLNWLNLREGYPKMSTETQQLLFDIFDDKIKSLEDILGRKLDLWREDITRTGG